VKQLPFQDKTSKKVLNAPQPLKTLAWCAKTLADGSTCGKTENNAIHYELDTETVRRLYSTVCDINEEDFHEFEPCVSLKDAEKELKELESDLLKQADLVIELDKELKNLKTRDARTVFLQARVKTLQKHYDETGKLLMNMKKRDERLAKRLEAVLGWITVEDYDVKKELKNIAKELKVN